MISKILKLVEIFKKHNGIDSYEAAKKRSKLIDGKFPCASIDDIIKSKRAAKRRRDKEELPRLEAFKDELKRQGIANRV